MKKIMAVLCLLVICVTCIPVYGTLSGYNTTIPAVGNKTVATGSKTSDRDYYRNSVSSNTEKEYIGWVETKNYGDWVQITDKYIFYPKDINKTHVINYNFSGKNYTPATGTELRFRIEKASSSDWFAGQNISGTINFE